jgi:PAS domain S-box-containing protein
LRQYQDQLTEILGDSGTNPFPQPVKDTLKLDEGRLKLLADATFEGICVHDHGVILDVNQQFADLLGYTADELKGMDCFGLVAPQFRDAVRNYISSGTQGPYESLGLRKDGSTFPVEVRIREFQLDGKVLRFAVFRDRTEQEEMCRQVIESSKWYRELYEHSPLALYRTRICDGTLLECNRALVELFGYDSKEEFQMASKATERYVDINDRTEFLEKLQRNGRVDGFQVQNIRKDGELIWIECRARFFPERGFIEGAMWDITIAKLLTKTEKKLLRLIMQGKSNKRIGFELERSIRTVEDHRANIMQKLGVDNIVELTQKATDFFAHDSWE